jgi:ATP-dependent protease ClpP protease subunit
MTTALKDGKAQQVPLRGYALLQAGEGRPTPVLYLYDIFGLDLLGGIAARQVVADLQALGETPDLDVRLNSSGGDVFEGIAVYNALARFPAKVTVHVDGMAASIASLVAMGGNRILVAENAMLMVHRPWTVLAGDAEEFRRQADTLEKAWNAMLATYARRTGRRAATLAERVTREGGEWWMTAEEAVAEGFADATEKAEKETAVFGLERFRKVPARLAAQAKDAGSLVLPPLPRTAEIAPPRVEKPVAEAAAPASEAGNAPEPSAPSVAARRRILDVARLGT